MREIPRIIIAAAVGAAVFAFGQTWDGNAQAQAPSPTTTVVSTPPPTASPTPTPSPVVVPAVAPYFSLGDSIADAEGATSRAAGYVALFAAKAWPLLGLPGTPAARGDYGLRGGETSTSMLVPGGQLDRATAEISRRNSDTDKANDVKLITVDIGGNDFRALTRSTSPCRVSVTSPECGAAVTEVTAAFTANYPVILQRIRAAAGPDTIIVAMAFYNPFSGTGQAVDAPGDLVAGQITAQAKAVATAAPVNAVWVDLFALFKGKAPQLTHINDAQSDIHPTDGGYAVIADAMFEALKAATAKPVTPAPPTVGTGPGANDSNAALLWLAGFVLISAAGVSLAVAARVRN